MGSARIARFVSEVAPPQFVQVIRQRTSKMLDTIKEDEREAFYSNYDHLSNSSTISFTLITSSSSSSSTSLLTSKYFLQDVQKSLPNIFGN
ncbi:hypothetical protein Leryth_012439 [Lithospermum erythrorhizon]|nr:hypothetical protein Leryth_012439 [Lithospermum erythrorhizon]